MGWEAGCSGLSPASPRILWRTETEIYRGWPGSSQWTLGDGEVTTGSPGTGQCHKCDKRWRDEQQVMRRQ